MTVKPIIPKEPTIVESVTELELGQYDVYEKDYGITDDAWKETYIVRKIMKKTCVVSHISYRNHEEIAGNTSYRFPKKLLLNLINIHSQKGGKIEFWKWGWKDDNSRN